jgi:hypothetical protein
MEKENIFIVMAMYLWVFGRMEKRMEEDNLME